MSRTSRSQGSKKGMPAHRYRPFPGVSLPDRRWPDQPITAAPRWCSVDLRDGNQALVNPMGATRKLRMYQGLVAIGFKEIEVGFPSASQTELDFVRHLIEAGLIPSDVTIQVLTQARAELIAPTVASIRGAERAIVHVYNSTSELQRRVVFGMDRAGILDIAVRAVRLVKELVAEIPETEVTLEYSPESFSGTEPEFALEICEAVMDVWQPTVERPIILNLPSTVEMSSPNVFADQVELFSRSLTRRDCAVVSVHPHNDRGCGVAAAELALMAGADRIEGTLFGNGERTGNVDIVTLALNMMTQGVDPELDFRDIEAVRQLAEECTGLPVHPRHPYTGELVFTAFSGSHQDAIRKGMRAQKKVGEAQWEVPYLPIDPADVGRDYEAIIRINSQSGKGGIAYLMEQDHDLVLPRSLQVEFSKHVQKLTNETGEELTSDEIGRLFREIYLDPTGPFELRVFSWARPAVGSGASQGSCQLAAELLRDGVSHRVKGKGSGPVHAFVEALREAFDLDIQVSNYSEHALAAGSDAQAVAYVELRCEIESQVETLYGVDRDESIVGASIRALLAALNRIAVSRGGVPEWPVARSAGAPVGVAAAARGSTAELPVAAR